MFLAGPDTCLPACRPAAAAPADASPQRSSESVSDDEVRIERLQHDICFCMCFCVDSEMLHHHLSWWLHCSGITHNLDLHGLRVLAGVWLEFSALRKCSAWLCTISAVRLMDMCKLSVLCCAVPAAM